MRDWRAASLVAAGAAVMALLPNARVLHAAVRLEHRHADHPSVGFTVALMVCGVDLVIGPATRLTDTVAAARIVTAWADGRSRV